LRTAHVEKMWRWKWLVGGSVLALLLVYVVALLANEPLRRMVEREINGRLQGYTMRIGHLDLHPIPLSLGLRDVAILQHPDLERPVVRLPRLSASLHWTALLQGRVAADLELDSPAVDVDRTQLSRVLDNPTPLTEKGREEALRALQNRQLNALVVRNGSLTYVEDGQTRPLMLSRVEALATEIGTLPSAADVYPSRVRITGVVADDGWLQMDGHADLLSVPHVGIKATVTLDRLVLSDFAPIAARYGLTIAAGTLRANGQVEYAPDIKILNLEEVRIDMLEADYAYRKRATRSVEDATRATVEGAKDALNKPGIVLTARRLSVHGATVGFVNEQVTPHYRVFLADTDLVFENFANQFTEGTATARLTGRFMGSGAITISAAFRPEMEGADFDLDARIENTDLTTLNDLLRAHAKADLVSGAFSVFAEARVMKGRVEGYVKPLFRELKLYGSKQDADKSFGQKLKERAADVLARALGNQPRQEVATVVPIGGPLDNPKADTWEALIGLIRNAFDKAILPGFERARLGLKR
jgi:Domain of Unknown Function (DUF748)